MLRHVWSSYQGKAMGADELRPISCTPLNEFGKIGMFLIDSLSTLAVMGEHSALRDALGWLIQKGQEGLFDVNRRVNVFEINIRILGGLISTHELLELDGADILPGYSGELLALAEVVAQKLLPAFDTPSKIPQSWVNLLTGKIPGEKDETCLACAGTLMLEFGSLSRLTGNLTYSAMAKRAMQEVLKMRSDLTGVPGCSIDTSTAKLLRRDSGIGAGSDSFYEYLLKSYLVFGDESMLGWFADVYSAAMIHMRKNNSDGSYWLLDIDIDTSSQNARYVSSLGAFWPGMQALMGHTQDAKGLFRSFQTAWRKFKWLPEVFEPHGNSHHPVESGYPLRPEHIESAYMLQLTTTTGQAEQDSASRQLVEEAARIQRLMKVHSQQRCGFASVQDVSKGGLSDRMESFFASETCLYMWLVFSGERSLLDHFVLTTEGHPIQIFAEEGKDLQALPDLPATVPGHCKAVCDLSVQGEVAASFETLEQEARRSPSLQALGVNASRLDFRRVLLLRRRRCIACAAVTERLAEVEVEAANAAGARQEALRKQQERQQAGMSAAMQCQAPGDGDAAPSQGVLCQLEQMPEGYICGAMWEPPGAMNHHYIQALPPNVVILHPQLSGAEEVVDLRLVSAPSVQGRILIEQQPVAPSSEDEKDEYDDYSDDKAEEEDGEDEDTDDYGDQEEAEEEADTGKEAEEATTPEDPRGPPYTQGVPAAFGPSLPPAGQAGIHGPLMVAEPIQGCEPLRNFLPPPAGAWVVVERGSCSFWEKVMNVQRAGGVGAIIFNTAEDNLAQMSGDPERNEEVTIPALMISGSVGLRLVEELQSAGGDGAISAEVSDRVVGENRFELRISILPNSPHLMQVMMNQQSINWRKIMTDMVSQGFLGDAAGASQGTAPSAQSAAATSARAEEEEEQHALYSAYTF
eukprot:TRINITY_DN39894_c0_g1_i9.p1 TRINITY_DN39894_c0_g1~~TRINITY_DN39894_c0_g1_i9.p1  ORF type:complete len:917 (-),score=194.63 TRINITY_DN39894_c0_g1_i9:78-2828(-)